MGEPTPPGPVAGGGGGDEPTTPAGLKTPRCGPLSRVAEYGQDGRVKTPIYLKY